MITVANVRELFQLLRDPTTCDLETWTLAAMVGVRVSEATALRAEWDRSMAWAGEKLCQVNVPDTHLAHT